MPTSTRSKLAAFTLFVSLIVSFGSAQSVGEPLSPFSPGSLDIHHIDTGERSAAFLVLPDSTTLLIDCGFGQAARPPAEGLKDARNEIVPIVRYLAERGKVHQVHMRNIRGGLHDFAEVYPDEGDIDFFPIMRVLRDSQFAFSICADHMPGHPDDPGKLQAFAYGNGYIRALIHAVNAEIAAS